MPLASMLNRTCTIIRRSESGSTDRYGNDIPSEDLIPSVCEVQQQRRTEDRERGEASEADWLGIFPAGTDLDTGDAVEVDGLGTFEMVGAPWPARNPRTQAESHVEATLRMTAGAGDAS